MDFLTVDNTEQPPTVEQYEELLDFLDPLSIGTRLGSTALDHQDQYGAVIHARILRLKMLGLADQNCARAAGINPKTLTRWKQRYPMLEADMERASQLAVVTAAKRLFALMDEDGPTAFQAVKFFLGTHADEFREKAELHIRAEPDMVELAKVIHNVYGVEMPGPGDKGGTAAVAELPAPGD